MNTTDLVALHASVCAEAARLLEAKNHDYTNGADANGDIFANFRRAVNDGLCENVMASILVRLSDKMARLATASRRNIRLKEESVSNDVRDAINYLVLTLAAFNTLPTTADVPNTPFGEQLKPPPEIVIFHEGIPRSEKARTAADEELATARAQWAAEKAKLDNTINDLRNKLHAERQTYHNVIEGLTGDRRAKIG